MSDDGKFFLLELVFWFFVAISGFRVALFAYKKYSHHKIGRIIFTLIGAALAIACFVLVRGWLFSDHETIGIDRETWRTIIQATALLSAPFFWYVATKKIIPWIER